MSKAHGHHDLIIIGGGVLGTFHAYHAKAKGLKVAVLEKDAAPREATVRNFGQVVPSGMDADWQNYGRRSLEIYNSIESECDVTVRNHGSIYLASDADEMTLLQELAEINKVNDYQSQLLTAEQCRQRYSCLKSNYCVGGLFFPDEISVNPREMIHKLQRYLGESEGIHFYYKKFALDIDEQSDGLVKVSCSDGTAFTAEKVIICSGSEFKTLFSQVYEESDLELVKLQMLRLKAQSPGLLKGNILTGLSIRRYESFAECPSYKRVIEDQETGAFWQQYGIHILFKQELDGSIILGDSHEYAKASAPEDLPLDLKASINQYFIDEGKKIFDLPSWEVEASWHGIYSQTKQEGGVFKHQVGENIHIVTGIGGKGMTGSAGFSEKHLQKIYS